MKKTLLSTSLLMASLLSACGGGGSSSGGSNPTPSTPTPSTPAADGFTYLFSGTDLISYNFTNDQFSDIAAEPKSFDLSLHANKSEFAAADAVFYLQNNHWMQVNRKTNQPEQVSSATLQTEVCDTFVLSDSSSSHLFYTTAGADTRCSDQDDNPAFRIDSSMSASSAPVSLANNLQITVNEADPVLINNRLVGLLIKDDSNNLLFSNLNTDTTVQLATNVTDQAAVYNFTSRDHAFLQVGKSLYNPSLQQLQNGELGTALLSTTSNAPTVYSGVGRLYYLDTDKGLLYHFDGSTGTSTLVYNQPEKAPGKPISGVNVGQKSLLIGLNSDEYISLNVENLSAPVATGLPIGTFDVSVVISSIAGGFALSGERSDGLRDAVFISDNGTARVAANKAQWLRVNSNNQSEESLPVILHYGDDQNRLSLWSADSMQEKHSLGTFSKDISNFRVDLYLDNAGKALLSSRSNTSAVNGQVFSVNINSANSLKVLKAETGHSVVN